VTTIQCRRARTGHRGEHVSRYGIAEPRLGGHYERQNTSVFGLTPSRQGEEGAAPTLPLRRPQVPFRAPPHQEQAQPRRGTVILEGDFSQSAFFTPSRKRREKKGRRPCLRAMAVQRGSCANLPQIHPSFKQPGVLDLGEVVLGGGGEEKRRS